MTENTAGYTAFTYTDDKGVEISAYEWAAQDPHAIVQISHGIGEHALRYTQFAETLRANGFTVYADDHRGHGETGRRQHGGDVSQLGKLGPGGLAATERSILALTEIAREQHPGVPLVMFSHSWGSLMAQRIINRVYKPFDALILSGSAYRTPADMESGPLNKRFDFEGATGLEWLSRDTAEVQKFIDDELCFDADIKKLFGLADAAKLFGVPGRKVADVPVLIVSGSDDALSRSANGLQKLADAYRRRGVHDVALRVYPGARHELLNETVRDRVTAEIITWMLDRFPRDA